jgi:hypothetical protein
VVAVNRVHRNISLGFTEEPVSEGVHICYIYDDDAERQYVMSKYLESGLLTNEKVLCLVEKLTPDEMPDSPSSMNLKPGALTFLDSVQGYCPTGSFNGENTLKMIRDFYHQAVDIEGYDGARGSGHMTWSLDSERTSEEALLEYEAHVNHLSAEFPCTNICQYDARRFSGRMIMNILRIHPMVIIRGQIVKNPYYVKPDILLKEYRSQS